MVVRKGAGFITHRHSALTPMHCIIKQNSVHPTPQYVHLHTAHCTLHTSHCILHTAHITLHTAHCTTHTTHSTLQNDDYLKP